MSQQPNTSNRGEAIFILAGTSAQYTAARQLLELTPPQAFWLTGASQLKGLSSPKVYRVGNWRDLPRIKAIEAALEEVKAQIIDVQQ